MITTADALDVMTVVGACHRRTAPRMDDREVTIATATIWAELFNEYRLEVGDLITAVKKRALSNAEAPEPAEIIQKAREIRHERDAKKGPTVAYQAICDSKVEDDYDKAMAALQARRAREQQEQTYELEGTR